MARLLPTQAQFLKTCRFGLTSPVFGEKRAGQCKRWVRQMQEGAGVAPMYRAPVGISAKRCAQWYRLHHPEMICTNGGLPGDLYFWEEGHGPDGHVFVREEGNMFMGNSTRFAPEGEVDGRGTVAMDKYEAPSLIVRTWKN